MIGPGWFISPYSKNMCLWGCQRGFYQLVDDECDCFLAKKIGSLSNKWVSANKRLRFNWEN